MNAQTCDTPILVMESVMGLFPLHNGRLHVFVQWIDYSYACELTGRENSKFYLYAWLP